MDGGGGDPNQFGGQQQGGFQQQPQGNQFDIGRPGFEPNQGNQFGQAQNQFQGGQQQGGTVYGQGGIQGGSAAPPQGGGQFNGGNQFNGGGNQFQGGQQFQQQPQQQFQQQQPPQQQYGAQRTYGGNSKYNQSARHAPYGGASNNGPVRKASSQISKLCDLTHFTGRWTVMCRVVSLSAPRTYTNAKGEGKMMKCELTDGTMTVGGCFFNAGVDKHAPVLQEGKVFTFSRGTMKQANPRFSRHAQEISFDEHSEIIPVEDEQQSNIPVFGQVNFIESILSVNEKNPNDIVDFCAMIIDKGQPDSVTVKRTGAQLKKRSMLVTDASNATIEFTVWGDQVDEAAGLLDGQFKGQDVLVMVKGAKVGDFRGKNLGTNFDNTKIWYNPDGADFPQKVHEVRQWWQNGGKTAQRGEALSGAAGGPMSDPVSLAAAMKEDEYINTPNPATGMVADVHWHRIKAMITKINKSEKCPTYNACMYEISAQGPQDKPRICNKKVEQGTDGKWCCAAGHESHTMMPRYILRFQFADHTNANWSSSFDEETRRMLGVEAQTVYQMYQKFKSDNGEIHDTMAEREYDAIFEKIAWKSFIFKMKSKKENYQEEERVKMDVVSCEPMGNFVSHGRHMIQAIDQGLANPNANQGGQMQ